MLSRVACRKHTFLRLRSPTLHRILRPRTLRQHSQLTHTTSLGNTSIIRPADRKRRTSFQCNRQLATATDHAAVVDQPSYGPGLYSSDPSYDSSKQWGLLFSNHLNEYDPSSLIILDQYLQTRPKVMRKIKGIGGDEEEMLANFDVSLRVGRFDRAASLIERFKTHYPGNSPEFLALSNRYLNAVVSHMIVARHHNMVSSLQAWFEVDLRGAGVIPDATTFAIMIRMSLRMLHGPKRDRTVRRYWGLAKKQKVEDEVLANPVLSELELGELSEICSSDLQRVAVDTMEVDATQPTSTVSRTNEVAPIRAVEQNGHGLAALQKSLSLFWGDSKLGPPYPVEGDQEEQLQLQRQMRQRRLEADALQSALDRWRSEFTERQRFGMDMNSYGRQISSMMHQWHTSLVARIKEELKVIAETERNPTRSVAERERCEYGVFLQSLDPDRIAALAILTVWLLYSRAGISNGLKVSLLITSIGKDFRDELTAEAALRKDSALGERRVNILKRILAGRKQKGGRGRWQALVNKLQEEDSSIVWPSRTLAKVGAVLMSMLFETAKVPVTAEDPRTKKRIVTNQPAFQHSYEMKWGRRSGVVHIHPELVKLASKEPPADLLCRHLPMVCEPRSWDGMRSGGYFLYESSLLRLTPGEVLQAKYVEAALEKHGLQYIRAGLDILGKTGWIINNDVFDVMLEAWNSGEEVANLPPVDPDFVLPPKPASEQGAEAERNWKRQILEIENKKAGLHSQRCFQNFQMEVARAYRNETFYLPHNMDFRGRAYPLPPYLNQMGADNCRGLLLFSEAKPLGESGLRWLKIHIANVFGYDKASLSEREDFTMEHLDDVLDSAKNGLHGRRWWLKAEDPWQCLAACFELRNALRLSDPTHYSSRLPVHQDGSCNGLQHYAALGGDVMGAKQVNLEPSDRPSDVYTGVADFVQDAVAKEAAQGHPIAKMLEGKITRKVVKQTVMTNVYGVTFIGATRQVRKQLIDHYPDLSSDDIKTGAMYIATKIFQALGSIFTGAHKIQFWLGDCASRISQSLSPEQIEEIAEAALALDATKEGNSGKVGDPAKKFNTTVIWTTPLGLPVVQPYRTIKTRRIRTTLQDVSIADPSTDEVVNKRRQLQAFPPNFIHSLDATHMFLSAIECNRNGLAFSAVHDSFWTHACDVDKMNRILRDAFVQMHSDNIVERLAAEFRVRYGKNLFLAKVRSSSKIGRAIQNYRKTTKRQSAKVQELLEEQKRLNLLNSDDPELRAQGRAMTTAASIFDEMNGCDDDLLILKSLGALELAHVPEDLEAAEKQEVTSMGHDDPALEIMPPDLGVEADVDSVNERQEESTSTTKKRRSQQPHVWLWLPLRFREVPSKGGWDVSRIRDSKYFFS